MGIPESADEREPDQTRSIDTRLLSVVIDRPRRLDNAELDLLYKCSDQHTLVAVERKHGDRQVAIEY